MPEQDDEGNELSDEKRDEIQQRIDEITEENTKAIEFNNNLAKIKAKVKIVYQEMPVHKDEVALIRLNNYREMKPDESTFLGTSMDAGQTSADQTKNNESINQSKAEEESFENFAIEDMPPKMIVVPSQNPDNINLIVYHSEAQYALRKIMIEVAKKNFKELEKVGLNPVLAHTHQKSKLLDERFEEHVVR